MDKKTVIILVLVALLVLTTSTALYLYLRPQPVHVDTSFLEAQINELERENSDLQDRINVRDLQIKRRDIEIDSLLLLPPLIETKYVKIYKEIDNSSAIDVVELSDSIFAIESISR